MYASEGIRKVWKEGERTVSNKRKEEKGGRWLWTSRPGLLISGRFPLSRRRHRKKKKKKMSETILFIGKEPQRETYDSSVTMCTLSISSINRDKSSTFPS